MRLPLVTLAGMEPNCEYSGPDFAEAQRRHAKRRDSVLLEHDDDRGHFLVLTYSQERIMFPICRPDGWKAY